MQFVPGEMGQCITAAKPDSKVLTNGNKTEKLSPSLQENEDCACNFGDASLPHSSIITWSYYGGKKKSFAVLENGKSVYKSGDICQGDRATFFFLKDIEPLSSEGSNQQLLAGIPLSNLAKFLKTKSQCFPGRLSFLKGRMKGRVSFRWTADQGLFLSPTLTNINAKAQKEEKVS